MLKNVLTEERQRVRGPALPSWLPVCVAFAEDPSTVLAPGSDSSLSPVAPASENSGATSLHGHLHSHVHIHSVTIDTQFKTILQIKN